MSDTHGCPVYGCRAVIPREVLMCHACWSLVPVDIRRGVHRKGQRDRNRQAVRDAVAAAEEARRAA